tara:strand:- start:1052 stop:1714 length:663 start_codon:yes stop_codon:yes gene_type:complete
MSITYPPHFSTTETYANRYDLDKINVFLEGDGNNPMYFSIDGISKPFAYGKHYFNLSILDSTNQDHQLKEGSQILFEVKSRNNIVLRSETSSINQQNGVITCFFEVLRDPLRTMKDIEDGEGTLTIVGILENKKTTRDKIPDEFQNITNYRCVFPINIRKNLINADSPKTTAVEHTKKTIAGAYSFVKNNVSANTTDGISYGGQGAPNIGRITGGEESSD